MFLTFSQIGYFSNGFNNEKNPILSTLFIFGPILFRSASPQTYTRRQLIRNQLQAANTVSVCVYLFSFTLLLLKNMCIASLRLFCYK